MSTLLRGTETQLLKVKKEKKRKKSKIIKQMGMLRFFVCFLFVFGASVPTTIIQSHIYAGFACMCLCVCMRTCVCVCVYVCV